jgi:phosphate-selective porin
VIHDDGAITSWSTWVSFFITGEQKRVGNFGWKQPAPRESFDPSHLTGTGAWEVLARYTATRTSESLFNTVPYGGDDYMILDGASRVSEYTLGLCWTWNPMLRWQLNYVHLNGNGLAGGSSRNEDMVGLRMIFKF